MKDKELTLDQQALLNGNFEIEELTQDELLDVTGGYGDSYGSYGW